MKARCPNDPKHDKFITVAHVAQIWTVDRDGEFLSEVSNDEILEYPSPQNIWTCTECGAEAEFDDA